MATTIRAAAIHWLVSKFGDTGNAVCTSKFYIPKKSRTRQSAWWLEISLRAIETPKSDAIDLVCEVAPGANEFYYLKVPVEFFKKEKPKLDVNDKGILRLHLSAEPEEMFIDRRGAGKIGFSTFLQTRYLKR